MKTLTKFIYLLIFFMVLSIIAWASGSNFNDTTQLPVTSNSFGNVGIGTTTPQAALVITNGNVGIGTWAAAGGSLIISSGVGNVGIGSLTPGQLLDVQGTARMTGFQLNLNPNSGYVMVGNNVGVGTWMSMSTLPGLLNSGAANDVAYYSGVTAISGSTSFVFNGTNVGIGTSAFQTAFAVVGGNVGIGTWRADGGALIVSNGVGNVGIATAWPGATLDVGIGTVRAQGLQTLLQGIGYNAPMILDRTEATNTITNTTAKTTIYSFSLPGNVLGTTGRVHMVMYGDYVYDNASFSTWTFSFTYGGNTLWTDTLLASMGVIATKLGWRIEININNIAAATNSQFMDGFLSFGDNNMGSAITATVGSSDISDAMETAQDEIHGTSATDSTTAQTLSLTIQDSTATTADTVHRYYAYTEFLQ